MSKGPVSPTRPNKATPTGSGNATFERLLAGAAELFRKKGYAATTTRELSALLGIQNASLYYHMQKKEDLLYQLCLATLRDVDAVFTECLAMQAGPLETLRAMILRYEANVLLQRDKHATMLVELRALSPERQSELRKLRDHNVARVRDVITQAQVSGQIRTDISAKHLALALFNLLNWSIFWYTPNGELSATQVANMLCTLFIDGATHARPVSSGRSRRPRTS